MFNISLFSNKRTQQTDEELVLATKRGEASAFEVLYERRNKKIYNYLRNLLNYNYDDTTATTSDVFIKFYEYNKTHDIDNVKSVLYRIAHNTAIDRIRTNQSQHEQSFDDTQMEQIADLDHEKQHINKKFQGELFQNLLQYLPPEQKESLYLYYQEEKSYEEIAEILGSNKNTIGTIIFTAKKKLNALAEQHGIKEALA